MGEYWRTHGRGWIKGYSISLFFSAVASVLGMAREVPAWVAALAFGLLMPTGALAISILLPRLKSRSFILTVLLQFLAITLCMGIAFGLSLHVCIAYVNKYSPLDLSKIADYAPIFLKRTETGWQIQPAMRSMQYAVLLTLGITAIGQISRKLGPGVLRNWMFGKYHNPREEERIFMFLDLKDSTTLAEQLGNLKFSALVRDFFAVMTPACAATGAEVSHYIGDEAVLSWQPRKGLKHANCLRFFGLMQAGIHAKRSWFESRYGVVPTFKAGVHIGRVVATEVGEVKSEIVFHGDVMNTTARITGLCASIGHDLLISGELAQALGPLSGFKLTSHGRQHLKGKVAEVEVLSVVAHS